MTYKEPPIDSLKPTCDKDACIKQSSDDLQQTSEVSAVDPRENCPWKCKTGDPKCLCAKQPVGCASYEEWREQQDNSILRSETAWQTIERAFKAGAATKRESIADEEEYVRMLSESPADVSKHGGNYRSLKRRGYKIARQDNARRGTGEQHDDR